MKNLFVALTQDLDHVDDWKVESRSVDERASLSPHILKSKTDHTETCVMHQVRDLHESSGEILRCDMKRLACTHLVDTRTNFWPSEVSPSHELLKVG